ncbi:MAG: 1,4-dihydroxy-2-naphthoate octaprenyltransferase, partial [Planctomycetota bacterium]
LLAGFSPVAIGALLAWKDQCFEFWAMMTALICAISVQIGTNFCNDYCDFFQGADTESRKGPTRAVQAGLISPRSMLFATVLMFSITGVASWMLYLRAGWPFLVLGVFSIGFGILYTAGRFSLAYLGIADPFVLFFFGPVAVTGTHYVQSLVFDWSTVIAGLGPGLLATGLLVVNNLRDIDEDRIANKRTLAVRFGSTFSRIQYSICLMGAGLLPVGFSVCRGSFWPSLASLTLIPGIVVLVKVWNKEGTQLGPCLGMTAGLLLMYTILFCLGVLIG